MEDVFWTDERVKEFVIVYNKVDKLITGVDPIMQTIKEFKESRTILFTTIDGVGIREWDEYWYVKDPDYSVWRCGHTTSISKYPSFSTKEAANEWVVMNKPVLSVKEVIDWAEKYQCFDEGEDMLINMAKSKLNVE
jgi:hypothetical protein